MSVCSHNQQDALYRSEDTVGRGRDLDMAGARALVDGLRDLAWWEENVPEIRYVEIVKLKGGKCSVGGWDPERGAAVIEMLPVHMNELTIVHELAHAVAHAQWGSTCHDPLFSRMFLQLTFLGLGSEKYAELYGAFERDGIDFA
jgi:hypothetical protein